jgi:hypothetical protein
MTKKQERLTLGEPSLWDMDEPWIRGVAPHMRD